MNIKRTGNAQDRLEAWVSLTPFDQADIIAMKTRALGEVLLTKGVSHP